MSGLKIEVNKDKDDSVHTENEELKDLKDFKNFISIKNEPKAIRSINYACIILIVLICVGIGLMSSLWFGISENNTDFIDSNEYLFVNRMMNTEILFEV